MALMIRGSNPSSVFNLCGSDENSATYALGWVLERSLNFRSNMIRAWLGKQMSVSDTVISLQKHGNDGGYTDIEVHAGAQFHIILEVKRWWDVPTKEQLLKYRPRLTTLGADIQRLVSISSADVGFAYRRLPKHVEAVEVVHQSWGDIQKLARKSHDAAASFEEKLWLRHLIQHLQEFVAMDRLKDNTAFVVSLAAQPMVEGHKHT